eukprot:gene2113-4129_t
MQSNGAANKAQNLLLKIESRKRLLRTFETAHVGAYCSSLLAKAFSEQGIKDIDELRIKFLECPDIFDEFELPDGDLNLILDIMNNKSNGNSAVVKANGSQSSIIRSRKDIEIVEPKRFTPPVLSESNSVTNNGKSTGKIESPHMAKVRALIRSPLPNNPSVTSANPVLTKRQSKVEELSYLDSSDNDNNSTISSRSLADMYENMSVSNISMTSDKKSVSMSMISSTSTASQSHMSRNSNHMTHSDKDSSSQISSTSTTSSSRSEILRKASSLVASLPQNQTSPSSISSSSNNKYETTKSNRKSLSPTTIPTSTTSTTTPYREGSPINAFTASPSYTNTSPSIPQSTTTTSSSSSLLPPPASTIDESMSGLSPGESDDVRIAVSGLRRAVESRDPLTSKLACIQVSYLCNGNSAIQTALGEMDVASLLMAILIMEQMDAAAIEAALKAIGLLCKHGEQMHTNNVKNILQFSHDNVYQDIIETITKHISNENICEQGCFAMSCLAYARRQCDGLAKFGVIQLVLAILRTYLHNPGVLENVLDVIATLSSSPENTDVMITEGILANITSILLKQNISLKVCSSVCTLLIRASTSNAFIGMLYRSEICDSIMKFIKKFINVMLFMDVCLPVCIQFANHPTLLRSLEKLGICEVVLKILQIHCIEKTCVKSACLLLRKLADHVVQNANKLREAGICEILVNILIQHDEVEICRSACLAITTLCVQSDEFTDLFGVHGACEQVFHILEKAMKKRHDGLIQDTLSTIIALLSGHSGNQAVFGTVGIAQIIPTLLLKNDSMLVLYNTLKVTNYLCKNNDIVGKPGAPDASYNDLNVARLTLVDIPNIICEILKSILNNKYDRNESITDGTLTIIDLVKICCNVIRNLSMFDSSKFGITIAKMLTKIFEDYCNEVEVMISALEVVLCQVDVEETALNYNDAGIATAVAFISRAHFQDPRVATVACFCISQFAIYDNSAESMIIAGICETVVDILTTHVELIEVVRPGVEAVKALLDISFRANVKLRAANIGDALIFVSKAIPDNIMLIKTICECLYQIGKRNGNSNVFSNMELADHLFHIIENEKYMNSHEIVLHWLSAIETLAAEFNRDNNICYGIMKCLRKYSKDREITLEACRAIHKLCIVTKTNAISLANANGCESIINALKLAIDSKEEEFVIIVIQAMNDLLQGNLTNLEAFGILGACELIITCFTLHHDWITSTPSHEVLVDAIGLLIRADNAKRNTNLGNLNKLVNAGAVTVIIKGLRRHNESSTLAYVSCQAVRNLAYDFNIKTALGRGNACEAVIDALNGHGSDVKMVALCVDTITSLATVPSNLRRIVDCNIFGIIIEILLKHIENEEIVVCCCTAITHVIIGFKDDENELMRQQERFTEMQIEEVLCNILNMYGARSVVVAATIEAIANLCHNNSQVSNLFDNNGILDLVITLLGSHYSTSETVARCGCHAIWCMVRDNPRTQIRCAQLGGTRNIVRTLQMYYSNSEIAIQACLAIHHLANKNEENSEIIGKAGACELVLTVMQTFCTIPEVDEAASLAATTLASNNADNARKLSVQEACEEVLKSIQRAIAIKDTDLVTMALGTVIKIASAGPSQVHCLGTSGVCEGIIDVFKTWFAVKSVNVLTLQAIAILCRHGSDRASTNVSNVCRFAECGAFEAILDLLKTKMSDQDVCRHGCHVICNMAYERDHQIKLRECGACSIVIEVLKTHMAVAIVAEFTCRAISNLTTAPSNAAALVHSDCFDYLAQTLRIHWQTDDCVLAVCAAIANFTANCDHDSLLQVKSTAIYDSLVRALKVHVQNIAVGIIICSAIRNLVETLHSTSREEFVRFGACEAIVHFLDNNSTNNKAVLGACVACHSLAYESVSAQEHFMLAGAGKSLVCTIVKFHQEVEICENACWAICNLSLNHQENKNRFGEIGACKSIIESLDCHKESLAMAEAACLAISSLTDVHARNSKIFEELGVGRRLLGIFFKHAFSEIVAEHASYAIVNLISNGVISETQLIDFKVAEAVVTSMEIHIGHADVGKALCELVATIANVAVGNLAEQACIAISNLCCDEKCLESLTTSSACEIVSSVLLFHFEKSSLVSKASCDALIGLAKIPNNLLIMHDIGVDRYVYEILPKYGNNEDILATICQLIMRMSTCEACLIELSKLGTCTSLGNLIKIHTNNPDSLNMIFCAMISLVQNNDDNALAFYNESLADLITELLSKYSSNENMVSRICQTISIVTDSDPVNKRIYGNLTFCKGIIQSLYANINSLATIGAGCCVICSLCSGNGEIINRENLRQSGASVFIGDVFRKHVKNTDIIRAVLICICTLASRSKDYFNDFVSLDIISDIINVFRVSSSASAIYPLICEALSIFVSSPIVAEKIGKMGVCELLSDAICQNIDDMESVSVISNAIHLIVRSLPHYATVFFQTGACSTLTIALERHMSYPEVVITVIQAIYGIIESDSKIECAFTNNDTAKLLATVLSYHIEDADIVTCTCRIASKVCTSHSLILRNENIFNFIVVALEKYVDKSEVIVHLCELMDMLIEADSENLVDLSTEGICEGLIATMQYFRDHAMIIAPICSIIQKITEGLHSTAKVFVSIGGCGVLGQALHDHPNDETVIRSVCGAITTIAHENDDYSMKFGDLLVCEQLINLIETFAMQIDMVRLLCSTLITLCAEHGNFDRLLSLDPCKTIIPVVNLHVEGDEYVLQSLFALVLATVTSTGTATDPVTRFWAEDPSACHTLINVLNLHNRCPELVFAICRIIHCISDGNVDVVRIIGSSSNACQLLAEVLEMYESNSEVVEQICFAIGYLCIDCSDNIQTFHQVEIIEIIIEVLKSNISNKGVSLAACFAIRYLAGSEEANILFGELRTCELLLEVIQSHTGRNVEAISMACWALRKMILNATDIKNLKRALKNQACAIIICALKRHKSFPDFAVASLWILRILATDNDAKGELGAFGTCELVLLTIEDHLEVNWVAIQGLWVIFNMTKDNFDENISRVAISEGCDIIVEVLRLHCTLLEVVERGCLLLKILVRYNITHGIPFNENMTNGIIADCLVRYSNTTISDQAVAAMRSILLNEEDATEKVNGSGIGSVGGNGSGLHARSSSPHPQFRN